MKIPRSITRPYMKNILIGGTSVLQSSLGVKWRKASTCLRLTYLFVSRLFNHSAVFRKRRITRHENPPSVWSKSRDKPTVIYLTVSHNTVHFYVLLYLPSSGTLPPSAYAASLGLPSWPYIPLHSSGDRSPCIVSLFDIQHHDFILLHLTFRDRIKSRRPKSKNRSSSTAFYNSA